MCTRWWTLVGVGTFVKAIEFERLRGVFEEMKWLFFFTPRSRIGGKVAECFWAELHATDAACAGVGHWLGHLSPNPNCEEKARCTRRVDAHATNTWHQRLVIGSRGKHGDVAWAIDGRVSWRTTRRVRCEFGENRSLCATSVVASNAEGLSDRRVCRSWTRPLDFGSAGHVVSCGATDAADRVYCLGDGRVWCPRFQPSEGITTIFVCGAINRSGRPWAVSWAHFSLSGLCYGTWEPSNSLMLDSVYRIEWESDSSALHREDCIEWH
jgi:hypothetical protein